MTPKIPAAKLRIVTRSQQLTSKKVVEPDRDPNSYPQQPSTPKISDDIPRVITYLSEMRSKNTISAVNEKNEKISVIDISHDKVENKIKLTLQSASTTLTS